MTVWDLMGACRRHFMVFVVGLLFTAGMGVWVSSQEGVYWAQSDMIFLGPTSSRFPNSLSSGSESLIGTASIVKNRVGLGDDLKATSSASITLVDDGVHDGTLVRLPNFGGQWSDSFSQPVLDIQAVGSSPDVVNERMQFMQLRITQALKEMQDEAGVDKYNRIQIQASPNKIEVVYVQGSRMRAVIITTLLGISFSLMLVAWLERRRVGRIGWPAFDADFTEIRWALPSTNTSRNSDPGQVNVRKSRVKAYRA